MTEEFIDLTVDGSLEPDATEMEIEVDESIGWAADTTVSKHIDLPDRNTANQHMISSITGLEDRLADIESIKTVESDKVGVANYYEWDGAIPADTGYFVSLASHSTRIKICDGTNIFGVTVDEAGFVGNQGKITPRDNTYALVATSGLVDVRCETGINVGDNVVSNADGVAVKTDSDCGYKVIAKETKKGVEYVSIVLGVQACTTNLLGQRVGRLEDDLVDAQADIARVMSVANEAAASAGNSNLIANDVNGKIENVYVVVDGMQNTLDEDVKIFEEATKAAEDAAKAAEGFAKDAKTEADKAMEKADTLKDETDKTIKRMSDNYSTLIGSIDKYTIGEYSTSYGLTINQANNILEPGMIYIPYPETHTETYEYKKDGTIYVLYQEFTKGYYYLWYPEVSIEVKNSKTQQKSTVKVAWWVTVKSEDSDNPAVVWYDTKSPQSQLFEFWFDGSILYKRFESNWVQVNTLAGNVNARIQSMIKQDVNSISATVSNLAGSVTGFEGRIDDVEASAQQLSAWKTQEDKKMASVYTVANADSTSVVLSALVKDNDGKIQEGAKLTLTADKNSSVLKVNAENIGFTADDYAVIANNIHMSAGTVNLVKNCNDEQSSTRYDVGPYVLIPKASEWNYDDEKYGTFGCLVPGKTYTVQIDITPAPDVTHVALLVSDSTHGIHNKIPVEGGTRQVVRCTFIFEGYKGDKTPEQDPINARINVRRFPWDGVQPESPTTVHQIKIEEGTIATGFDAPSSDFSSSQMNWKMNRDKCVWWNAKGSETDYLMQLDKSGLAIKGTVDAESGSVGGWTLQTIKKGDSVSTGLTSGDIGASNSFHMYTAFPDDGTTPTVAGHKANNWSLTIGSNFGVDMDGQLYASGGAIGGWQIGKGSLESHVQTKDPKTQQITSDCELFINSNSTYWIRAMDNLVNRTIPRFSVSKQGKLWAEDAKIVGHITASEGKIGNIRIMQDGTLQGVYLKNKNWTLNGSGLTSARGFYIQSIDGSGLRFTTASTSEERCIIDLWLDVETTVLDSTYELPEIKAYYLTLESTSELSQDFTVQCDYQYTTEDNEMYTQGKLISITAGQKVGKLLLYEDGTGQNKMISISVECKDKTGEIVIPTNETRVCLISAVDVSTQTVDNRSIKITGNLEPENDDAFNLGLSSKRWKDVYATNNVIQTSDKNEKNTVQSLNGSYNTIFDSLKPVSYKFNKNTSNRTHIGFIAQDVKEAIEGAGLTTQDFAGYCEWDEGDGQIGCGLRYGEFISLNTWQIQKLKGRVAELEAKLNELTEKNNQTVQND